MTVSTSVDEMSPTYAIEHHVALVNGIRLHYLKAGAGNPVVLLHGFAQTSQKWIARVIPALAAHYTVIAPDLRSSGDSKKPANGYDEETLAEDVYHLVQHLGFKESRLVGHDFGANTAYPCAAAHRKEVRKLVFMETLLAGFDYEDALKHPFAIDGLGRAIWHIGFLDSPYGIPEVLIAGRECRFLSWFHQQFVYDPTAVSATDLDEYVRCFSSPGGTNARKYYSTHCEDAEYNRELAKSPVKIPVLAFGSSVFLGNTPKQSMEQLALDVRGGAISNCGHWTVEEQPDFLIRECLAFSTNGHT